LHIDKDCYIIELIRKGVKKMEFYTPYEVAEILKVSYRTVHKLLKNGDIESIKVGAHYRVPASAIEKLKYTKDNKDEKVQE